MLHELRKFILGYPDNFGFEFDEEIFLQGLKFSCQEKYPWETKKQMGKYFDKLYEHESSESYQQIIELETRLHYEKVHIFYSRALVLRLSSLVMISAGLILIALQLTLPSIVFAGTGILMLLGDAIFRRKGSKSHESLVMLTMLLKFLIEQVEEKNQQDSMDNQDYSSVA